MPVVAGTVLAVKTRSGVSAKSGEPWSMTTVRVLEDEDVCDVTLGDKMQHPDKGDSVAYYVNGKPGFRGVGVEYQAARLLSDDAAAALSLVHTA